MRSGRWQRWQETKFSRSDKNYNKAYSHTGGRQNLGASQWSPLRRPVPWRRSESASRRTDVRRWVVIRRCTSRRSGLRARLGSAGFWLRLLVASIRTKPKSTKIAPTAMSTSIGNNMSPSPHRCASLVVHIRSFRLGKLSPRMCDVKPVRLEVGSCVIQNVITSFLGNPATLRPCRYPSGSAFLDPCVKPC